MQVTLGLANPVFHGRVQPELLQPFPTVSAGAGWTYTVPTNYYERPIALSFVFETAAHAATRQVGLSLLDPGGAVVAAVPVASSQITTLTYTYSFVSQLSSAQAVEALVVISPLFNWVIPSSYQLAVTVANIYSTDQISAIRYYRDRFSTGKDGYPMGGYEEDDLADSYALLGALTS